MKMIETSTKATALNVIRERLQSLGVRRITAVQALDLGGDDAQPAHRLSYRGVSVEARPSLFQLRVLVDDAAVETTITALRWLANSENCPLGAIVVSPVEVLSASNHATLPRRGGEAAAPTFQS